MLVSILFMVLEVMMKENFFGILERVYIVFEVIRLNLSLFGIQVGVN